MLAAAAAPAIVRSESLMKIIVPRQEIILPTLNIVIPGGPMSAGTYTAGLWVKAAGGQWERMTKTFTVGDAERAVKLELPHKNPMVYGLQLHCAEGKGPFPVSVLVSDGGISFDPQQTPYMPGERIGKSTHWHED